LRMTEARTGYIIWWKAQMTTFIISLLLLHLRSTYSHQHPFSNTLNWTSLMCKRLSFSPIQNITIMYSYNALSITTEASISSKTHANHLSSSSVNTNSSHAVT
jgi:hypothetical protein